MQKYLFCPHNYLLLIATSNTAMVISRDAGGWLMKSAHHIFSMRRVHMGHLSTRASSGIFMYVVNAKIPFLPSKLSPTHSHCQHGHGDISGCRGVVDEERSSYFHHAPSAYGPPFNTCKLLHLYVRCKCKNTFFALKIVSYS